MIMNDGNVDDGGNVDADDEVYLEAACIKVEMFVETRFILILCEANSYIVRNQNIFIKKSSKAKISLMELPNVELVTMREDILQKVVMLHICVYVCSILHIFSLFAMTKSL